MKKLLLGLGIVNFIFCALSLGLSAMSLFGYYNVMDASNALLDRLHQRFITFLVLGLILGALGAVCLLLGRKK